MFVLVTILFFVNSYRLKFYTFSRINDENPIWFRSVLIQWDVTPFCGTSIDLLRDKINKCIICCCWYCLDLCLCSSKCYSYAAEHNVSVFQFASGEPKYIILSAQSRTTPSAPKSGQISRKRTRYANRLRHLCLPRNRQQSTKCSSRSSFVSVKSSVQLFYFRLLFWR